jgi:hypothetical protein
MLWIIGMCSDEKKKLVLCACKCARLSLKYVPEREHRPHKAIKTAENWAQNQGATINDVGLAMVAAIATTKGTHSVSATYAAYAAAAPATIASSGTILAPPTATALAAYGAAAHAGGAAAHGGVYGAREEILNQCAGIVREFYPDYEF